MNNRVLSIVCTVSLLWGTACGGGGGGDEAVEPGRGVLPPPTSSSGRVTIPNKSAWESNMVTYGRRYCDSDTLAELSTWEGSVWYYDGIRVYYQIASYTGDQTFAGCARAVREIYRGYVLASSGKIPGWRVFTAGLLRDFQVTGDESPRRAVLELASNSAYAPSAGAAGFEFSRETAYILLAYLDAQELGGDVSGRLEQAAAYARGHVSQWLTSAPNVKPFMVALTAEALISYAERTGSYEAVEELPVMARWLRDNAWDSRANAFRYLVCRDNGSDPECNTPAAGPAPDLSLLIAPLFAFAAQQSGDSALATFGDSVFGAGVQGAYLGAGKQFSQNYRWSFDYVRRRSSMGK